jgi:isoleucyl-tRNA synthetase
MKFAANGTLYRGSKPVMWSVVEKTALAEAEIEYEDYTSDTVWVKFPVNAAHGRLAQASRRDLDHHALDAARQPRHQLLAEDQLWPLQVTDAPADNWAKTGDLLILADKLAEDVFKQSRVDVLRKGWRRLRRHARRHRVRHPLKRIGGRLRIRRPAARRRSCHRRHRHRLCAHRAKPRPRGLRHLDGQCARCSKRAASTRIFPTPSMPTAR